MAWIAKSWKGTINTKWSITKQVLVIRRGAMQKVDRDDFAADLKLVALGATQTKISEQLMHVFFTKKHLMCFGGEMFVALPMETDFACSVVADDLLHVVEKMSTKEIELSCTESHLIVKAKRSKAGIPIATNVEIVAPVVELLEQVAANTFIVLPMDFMEGVMFNMFSVSTDYTQGILTCISATGQFMYSSDDLRISEYKLSTPVASRINLPIFYLEPLLVNVPKSYYETPAWYCFDCTSKAIVGVKKYLGDFPDVTNFFEVGESGQKLSLPKELKNMLKDILILCEGEYTIDKKAMLTIAESEITCRGESLKGWFEKTIEMQEPFSHNLTVIVNPIFLAQVLEKCNDVFFLGDRLLFTSEKFRHILALPVGVQ